MSTPAQVAANQQNAKLSTGPKTEDGKAISSKNNLRHGFTGAFMILPWEKQEEFDTLLAFLASSVSIWVAPRSPIAASPCSGTCRRSSRSSYGGPA